MNIINIRSEERAPTLILMMMFFCVIGSSITGASARDTFFLMEFDKSLLPLMFAAVALVMVTFIAIYNRIASKIDLNKAIYMSSSFFCLTLFIIMKNLEGIVIPIFYAWTDVIISITIIQFWLLASEIFNPRQAKRLFSLIGVGGSIAGISSGYLIRPFVQAYGAGNLLLPTIIMIALIAVFASFLQPYRSEKKGARKEITSGKKQKKIFNPYLKSILIMVCSAAICSRIIEYQFKITAANSFNSSADLAAFFGEYYMILNAATLFMQLLVTGYVLHNFGILGGLILLPLGLAIGSLSFLMVAGLSSIFIARLFDQTFKFSIQSTSNELLWTPVQKQKARRVKPLIDSSIKSIIEGIIGIAIYFVIASDILPNDKIYLLSIPVIFVTGLWIVNNFRIRNKYISTLENAINHRHLNLENIQFDTTDSHIVRTINEALNDEDMNKQIFAIDLIRDLPIDKWVKTLNSLLLNSKPEVQKEILLLAGNTKNFIEKNILLNLSDGEDEIAALAISLNSDNELNNLYKKLINNLDHSNGHIIASSAVGILRLDKNNKKAKSILNDFLDIKDEATTALALDYLKNYSDLLPRKTLHDLLSHSSLDISNSALNVAGKRLDPYYLPAIISNLKNIKIVQKTRSVLGLYNHTEVINALNEELVNGKEDLHLKLGVVKTLGTFPYVESFVILRSQLNKNNLELSIACSDGLLKIAKTREVENQIQEPLIEEIKIFAKQYFTIHCFMTLLIDLDKSGLIIDQIITEQKKLVHIILKLVSIQIPESPIDSHIKHIIDQSDKDLPFILEFFDTSFSKAIRDILMPIIDPEIGFKQKNIDHENKKNSPESHLKNWAESTNQWKSAISIDYIINHNKSFIEEIKWDNVAPSQYLAEIFDDYKEEETIIPINKFKKRSEQNMFTILEKTILLKTVDLFQDIPGDLLSQISQISRAKNYENGEIIFKEGDAGDSMFIVLDGEISIKKGDKLLAKLERGASLGEMALLDHETRSADAMAEKDSVLLKINQDVFYELMESNADIMKQIIKLLTSRIREANTKLEQSLK